METKLYVSQEALELKGKEYFKELDINELIRTADNSFVEYEGLLLSRDDMYNLYLSVEEDDSCFTDVEDLQKGGYQNEEIN